MKKNKILIIDDDTFLLGMYSMKFEKSGFETKVASSGSDAVEYLRNGYTPDVLVTDLIMPVMDGFALCECIKKEKLMPENSLIIMLTNQGTSTDINRAKELGVHGFIVKATTIPSEVVEEVKKLINKYQQSL